MTDGKKRLKLNTLCYQCLGVLLREPQSGYDIVKQLQVIRPVNTSQVYPTLMRLEKQGLVQSEELQQTGRPNKRIYTVTGAGREALTDWIGTEPEPPVLRDDFLTMVYSAWTKEPAEVVAMFERRLRYLHTAMERLENLLARHRARFPEAVKNPRDWRFYRSILLARRIASLQEDVIWSRGVIHMLEDATAQSASARAPEGE
ncbi:PadR family transcriptional regulator [Oceanibium sediminis]|uniref:PadR family transcriptional regulator n=1 Tax=Oceanibium sediminis TaxID=2026339 RepID=UPI000DD3679A|nr:PadR family transcriptional regulator [Oceanibium sediminis]